MKSNWNKCDVCGQFISLKDFESGDATRQLLTPDSDYSYEEYETLCRKHTKELVYEIRSSI